jgi:hypothetical protein
MDMNYRAEEIRTRAGDYNVSCRNETLKRQPVDRERSVRKTSFFKDFALPY